MAYKQDAGTVSLHECGHAVMSLMLGMGVRFVTIDAEHEQMHPFAAGLTLSQSAPQHALNALYGACAGHAADGWSGFARDAANAMGGPGADSTAALSAAQALVDIFASDAEQQISPTVRRKLHPKFTAPELVRSTHASLKRYFRTPEVAPGLRLVADALYAQKTMTGEQVASISGCAAWPQVDVFNTIRNNLYAFEILGDDGWKPTR